MNEQIHEASKVVQNVLMASPNGVLVLQPIFSVRGAQLDLFLTAVNATAHQDLDRPASEVLGQSLGTYFPHLGSKECMDRYWQVLSTKKPVRFQAQGARLGQAYSSRFDISAVPLEHNLLITYSEIKVVQPDTSPEPWINILQQAFDESASGLSVFETLFDEQGQPSDFRLVRINKAGLVMSGHRRKEIVGKTLWEIYPATRINGLFDEYVKVWQTGKVFTGEHYYPEYDLWRDVTIVRLDRGVLVTYSDTTAIRKKEEKARLKAALLDDILEQIPLGLAVLSPIQPDSDAGPAPMDYRLMLANLPLKKLTGLPPDHMTGQLVSRVFSQTNAGALVESCRLALEKTTVQVVELAVEGVNGFNGYRASVAPKGESLIVIFTPVQSA